MTVLSFFLNIGENVSVTCKIGDVMFSNSKKDNLKFCHKSLIVVDERSEETTLYSGTNHPPPTI